MSEFNQMLASDPTRAPPRRNPAPAEPAQTAVARALLHGVGEPAFLLAADGRVLEHNAAAEDIAACAADLMLARDIEAMSRCSGIAVSLIERLMSMRSAKGLVSLVWKCGFTMRLAAQLQLRMAGIPPQSVLRARSGLDFPLSEADMDWPINFIKGLGQG